EPRRPRRGDPSGTRGPRAPTSARPSTRPRTSGPTRSEGTGRRWRASRSGGRGGADPSSRHRLQPDVRLQTMPAALATEAALLVAAEGRGWVEPVERVGPDDAGAHPFGHPEDPRALLGPDAGAEPVRGVVRLLHRLLRGAEREDRQHGSEDLLARDPVGLRHAGEQRRCEPEAALRQVARRLIHHRALLDAARDELPDLVELRPRVDRADVRVLVERV